MASKPRAAPPPRPVLPALTAMERWYLECLRVWSEHYKRAPRMHELAAYCGKTKSPVFDAMQSLKHKGYVVQNSDQRFEVK